MTKLYEFQKPNGETAIFARWVKCAKEKCENSHNGRCFCGRAYCGEGQDFPADGMCLYPDYMEYDKGVDEMGVYEDGEKVAEVVV
jgi:hypothetical protein